MTEHHTIDLDVNGRAHRVTVEARRTLADVLRQDLGLTGTHLGCEHGICGACTVLVDGEPARSCLLFGVQLAGRRIETVEGLAAEDGTLSPLQEAFSEQHGLQCGFCTPGFLMLATGLLREDPAPDDDTIREVAASNLCRCTGYQGILDAIRCAVDAGDREDRPPGGSVPDGAGTAAG
ncbi:(2Fe-2S)-binding protein [Nitriliruptor alkaliphilus]|uniref:(2Fe-2S)-binding protein n=1 Tax=Nitriliruptor alkaliphilus TaxID=427918 RepID=UPI000698EF15|nr:(2Fe-2S)-binding protein [Nitriliruptor alkaliphilus]